MPLSKTHPREEPDIQPYDQFAVLDERPHGVTDEDVSLIFEEADEDWHFVEEQTKNQINTYGQDPIEIRGEVRARYLRDMTLACTEELHEILRENSWKPWHRGRAGYGEMPEKRTDFFTGEETAMKDLVAAEFADVMCFLGNLARVHGLSTEDIAVAHRKKLMQNAERHADQA